MIDFGSAGLTNIDWGQVFHVGLRVPDMQQAQEELTGALGVRWTIPATIPMRSWAPNEAFRTDELIVSFSVEGPVHLELLQGAPGSYWDSNNGGAGLHHIGVWVDDLAVAAGQLVDDGWTVERAAETPENGYGGYAYVRSPAGVLFEPEVMGAGTKERFDRWYAGEPLF